MPRVNQPPTRETRWGSVRRGSPGSIATHGALLGAIALLGCAAPLERPPARPAAPRASGPAAAPQRFSESPHLELGLPRDADPSDDHVMDKGQYVVGYSDARRVPMWVAWRVTRDDLGTEDRADDFRADESLPATFFRVVPAAYAGSGFDRGHLCPSAHRTASREANSLTFLMTNMQPQAHALNAGPWKSLETRERRLAEEGKTVFVVAGGIFGPEPPKIGPEIHVPAQGYRITVVLEPGQGRADVTAETELVAAVLPNGPEARGKKWRELTTSVDEIERQTGYDFLSKLGDEVERALEARRLPGGDGDE